MDTGKLQHFISNPPSSLIKFIVTVVELKYSSHTETVDSKLGGVGGGAGSDVVLFEWPCYHLAEIVCSGLITG